MLKIYMEYCQETLHDFMEDAGRPELTLADLQYVTVGVLRGLDHLHQQNIIHRDEKPQNILLKRNTGETTSIMDMTIKLSDYNVSKWSTQEDRTATQTPMVEQLSFVHRRFCYLGKMGLHVTVNHPMFVPLVF